MESGFVELVGMHIRVKDVHDINFILFRIHKEEIRNGSKPPAWPTFLVAKGPPSAYQPQYTSNHHLRPALHAHQDDFHEKRMKQKARHLQPTIMYPTLSPSSKLPSPPLSLQVSPLIAGQLSAQNSHNAYKLLSTFFPYNQQTNHPSLSQMGVSISKSNAYTDMQRKAQQRAASRSKENHLKNNVKATMEGSRLGKENDKQARASQLAKSILGKHPIENLAQSSDKITEGHSPIYDQKQLIMQQQFPHGMTNNRKILNSLKRSLQMPEQSTHEDEHYPSPTQEFTKVQTSHHKTSNHLSCSTILTKKKIDDGNMTDFGIKTCVSGKIIESQAREEMQGRHSSGKMMADDPFSNPNDWRTTEDSPQVDRRFITPKSITLSNKFAQMGPHLQEKRGCQIECKVAPVRAIVGSRRSRAT